MGALGIGKLTTAIDLNKVKDVSITLVCLDQFPHTASSKYYGDNFVLPWLNEFVE